MLGEGTWSRRILIAAAVLWYQPSDFSLTLLFGFSDFVGERFLDLLVAK